MKKFLLVLFATASIFAGCKKDAGTAVNIGTADLVAINHQLKGAWLFPIENQKILDTSGKALVGSQYIASPAMEFDGNAHVTIYRDTHTILKGTYSLSTTNGFIYMDVTYPDGTDINYQLLFADALTLRMISTEPYIYYNGGTPQSAQSVSNVVLKKQTGADVTGNIIRVVVKSDTASYSVAVSVRHTKAAAPADTTILLTSQLDAKGTYTYEFVAKSGDQLTVDVVGDYTKTSFYAFYNGIPMAGNIGYYFQEIKTTTGWTIP